MLQVVQSLMKRELRVVWLNFNRLLGDDRTVIDPLVDEVDRDTRDPNAMLERVGDRCAARKGRQQRGMDVEDAVGEPAKCLSSENPHEARQNQGLSPRSRSRLAHFMGEGASIPVPANDHWRDCGYAGPLQRPDARPIRDDDGDLEPGLIARVIYKSLKVCARSGHQHRNPDGPLPLVAGSVEVSHRVYGGGMRYHWALDRHVLHLNHGSYGATPRVVQDAQRRWRDEFEANPTGFIEDRYYTELDRTRSVLGDFLGADPAGLAFVTNATSGIASVLASIEFGPGDEILTTDHAYNACRTSLEFTAARTGASVVTAQIKFPSPEDAAEAVLSRVTPATRLVVVDHVTSPTALILPIERIVAELEPEVPVLVDGAHGPGMVELDLDALGASYYAANLHKWVCAPKGTGFLSVAARHLETTRPTVISHGWNKPRGDESMFHRLFDWTGTFDPSAWLSVTTALEVMEGLDIGGWPGVMAANRSMALAARTILCERLGVPIPAPESMIGSMAALPVTGLRPGLAGRLREKGIVAVVSPWPSPEHEVLRVSAQRYNSIDEYHSLAEAILAD